MVAAPVRSRSAQVVEQWGVRAAGVLQGISQALGFLVKRECKQRQQATLRGCSRGAYSASGRSQARTAAGSASPHV
jgi:hypothetical protein